MGTPYTNSVLLRDTYTVRWPCKQVSLSLFCKKSLKSKGVSAQQRFKAVRTPGCLSGFAWVRN